MVEAWDDLTTTLGAAVRDGVDGGLRADRLRRWRFRVPSTLDTDPVVVLIDGLIAREDDPTSTSAWERIQLAAAGFAECGHHELELVALLQLGYLARIRGDLGLLEPIGERTRALADVHPPARPFLAFGDAWAALGTGRPDLQLAALESIADADLPPVWRVTRDHLIAHALFNLGRPHEALEVVPRQVETLPMPIPGALVTESQCLWNAGHPDEALRQRPGDTSHRYGARDRFIAGGWNGMMFAFAGDGAAARRSVDVARSHLGEAPSPVMSAQTSGVEALIAIAEGRDDDAAQTMGEILAFVPLGHGIGEQMLRNTLAIPYVLVPSSRDFWSQADLGPSLQTMRRVAAAFVDAREDGNRSSISHLSWPDPGTIAATLPCPWAIEFSLHGLAAGRQDGRRLAAWLCEHWGEPARDALRTWVDDDELGEVARDVLTHTPTPPDHPVSVQVLGPTNVRIDGFPTQDPDLRRERVRALLVCLVLRPATTRDQLAGTLWPDQPTEKAHKNLRTTLAYLHSLLEPRRAAGDATWFVRVDGHHIRLHHDLDVDVWAFTRLLDRAEQAEREGRPHTALPLFREAIELWGGDLAEDLDHEWLDLERIHLRSRFVRAACRAAELLVATHEAGPAVDIARRALDIDRWNDRSYLALAAAYDALGDHTSARAVLRRGEEATGAPIEGARRIAARGGRP
jgi:DNA-binding SARP family transcriptional activator